MVKVFAPVNIAWIKYMGKEKGLPTNASFSMTLQEAGTHTQIQELNRHGPLQFTWSQSGYVPPELGREKAEAFLKNETIWKQAIEELGHEYQPLQGTFEIKTQNSVPAGTGIATSASGFAALTLAGMGIRLKADFEEWRAQYAEDEDAKKVLARLSSLGSGSACRSFGGPFVEWDPKGGIKAFEPSSVAFVDFILILDREVKAVSSSEAHRLVATSPLFSGRIERVNERLFAVKDALQKNDLDTLSKVVLEEALDMHELFHTSKPPFAYMNSESKKWIERFRKKGPDLPSTHAIVTLDAGANVHVFVPAVEERLWEAFFLAQNELTFVKSKAGLGAHYVES